MGPSRETRSSGLGRPVGWRSQGNLTKHGLVKPRETRDEGMQQADTQIPLRCSSPANGEAQPDLCRKGCPKG